MNRSVLSESSGSDTTAPSQTVSFISSEGRTESAEEREGN